MQGKLAILFRDNLRYLLILLGLVVIIVVLVVLVVVNAFEIRGNGGIENGMENLYTPEEEASFVKQDEEYLKEYNEVEAKVSELKKQDPIDFGAINTLYDDVIKKSIEKGGWDYAMVYITDRNEHYINMERDREALDALLTVDFDAFYAPDRYRLYSMVIELAEELGDQEVVSKYTALRETVRDAYESDFRGVERSIEEGVVKNEEEE